MESVNVQDLISAGVHFGCPVSRWNPKMAPYIHGRRNMIHVLDLRETIRGLIRAQNFLFHVASEGADVLWVGTKRQIKGVIREAGERAGQPIVTERWIGGTLTNFSVIRSRLRRLEDLEQMEENGQMAQHSKKMVATLRRERRKIERNLSGIREMGSMPGALVIVDPAREHNAVKEARKMGIPVIGILDTDCDPGTVDIVIPGNDDALKSVRLLVDRLVSAVEEGRANRREQAVDVMPSERESSTPGDEPRPTRNRPLPRRRAPEAGSPTPVAVEASKESSSESGSSAPSAPAEGSAGDTSAS
jgi:small subunit ribosomal protein S2